MMGVSPAPVDGKNVGVKIMKIVIELDHSFNQSEAEDWIEDLNQQPYVRKAELVTCKQCGKCDSNEKNKKITGMWKGVPFQDLTREELYEIIEVLSKDGKDIIQRIKKYFKKQQT